MIAELKKLTRLSAVYGTARLLNGLIGILLIPIYTRYLSPADYGLFSLYTIAGQVVTIMSLMGVGAAMFREVVFRNADERTAITTALYFQIAQAVVFFGALVVFSPQLSQLLFGEEAHTYLLQLIFVTNGLSIFGLIVLSILQMGEQAVSYSVLYVVRFVVGVALNILFIVVWRQGLEGLILAGLVTVILTNILAGLLFVKIQGRNLRPRISLSMLRRMLRFGLPLVPFQLASIVLTSSDRFFLEHYAGTAEVGIYSLGYKFGMIVQLLVAAVQTAWETRMFAIAKEEDAEHKFARIVLYYLTAAGFVGLAISVLCKEALVIVADPTYFSAYTVVPLIVLSYIAYGGVSITNVALNVKARTELNAPIIIAVAVGNLALNYLLIPRFGMMGAAWATILSYSILLAVEVMVNQRIWRMPLEYGRMVKLAIAWGGVYAASLLIASGNVWLDVVLKTVLLLAFPLALYLLRFFDESELRVFWRVRRQILDRLSIHPSR